MSLGVTGLLMMIDFAEGECIIVSRGLNNFIFVRREFTNSTSSVKYFIILLFMLTLFLWLRLIVFVQINLD